MKRREPNLGKVPQDDRTSPQKQHMQIVDADLLLGEARRSPEKLDALGLEGQLHQPYTGSI